MLALDSTTTGYGYLLLFPSMLRRLVNTNTSIKALCPRLILRKYRSLLDHIAVSLRVDLLLHFWVNGDHALIQIRVIEH